MIQKPLPDHHLYIHSLPPTPLVSVAIRKGDAPVWCKLEFLNPSRSIKDRIARYILEKAWRQGKVSLGSWVVEASSGSTSIALALVAAQMRLKFLAVIPEGCSEERLLILRSFGAELILTPKGEGMKGALARAEKEAEKRNGFYTRQFENPDNAEAHFLGTGQEILSQMPRGCIDAVVCGVGTGGTIVGLTKAFQAVGCECTPYAAIPKTAAKIGSAECASFSSRIPGIVDKMSKLYTKENLPDAVELEISDDLAIQTTWDLIALGFPVGPSSGLNYAGAQAAAKLLGKEASIVTVFPDGMEKYFSTDLFDPFRKK